MNVLVVLLGEGFPLSLPYSMCTKCSGKPNLEMKDYIKNLGCNGVKLSSEMQCLLCIFFFA